MTGKKRTKPTKKEMQAKRIEILQQAIVLAQEAGIGIQIGNHENSFVVIVAGYTSKDGVITKCKK